MKDILMHLEGLIAEILDIEPSKITPDTYLIRDLGAESIDLLELGVKIGTLFSIEVNDDQIFLRRFRQHLEISGADSLTALYPHLSAERIDRIIGDLDGGPTLKVADVAGYIHWKKHP